MWAQMLPYDVPELNCTKEPQKFQKFQRVTENSSNESLMSYWELPDWSWRVLPESSSTDSPLASHGPQIMLLLLSLDDYIDEDTETEDLLYIIVVILILRRTIWRCCVVL